MFDSFANNVMPGKLKLVGWPWHGLLRMPKAGGTPTLELPNGTTAQWQLTTSPISAPDWQQHGLALKFRDPRAQDIERTPAQLARDQSEGIEWRAEALFSPREQLVYGQKPRNGATGNPCWLCHFEGENYRAELDVAAARVWLRCVSAPRPLRQLPLSGLPSAPYIVLDALPDGSKVLLGLVLSALPSPGGGLYPWLEGSDGSLVAAELGSWFYPVATIYELSIGATAAQAVRVKGARDDLSTTTTSGPFGSGEVFFRVTYDQPLVPVNRPYTASIEYAGRTQPETSDTVTWLSYSHRRSTASTAHYNGLTVGARYAVGGSIEYVTADIVVERSIQCNEADIANLSIEGVASYHVASSTSITSAQVSFDLPLAYSCSVTMTGTLKVGGVVQAELAVAASSEVTHQYSVSALATPNSNISVPTRQVLWSSGGDLGGGYTGQVIAGGAPPPKDHTVSIAVSAGGETLWSGIRQVANIPLPDQNRNLYYGAAGSSNYFGKYNDYGLAIHPVSYSPQLLALSVLVPQSGNQGTVFPVTHQVIGPAVTPAGAAPGHAVREAPLGALNGAYNPITGAVVRDAPTPVCWI